MAGFVANMEMKADLGKEDNLEDLEGNDWVLHFFSVESLIFFSCNIRGCDV
jgi:hypothetical protein